MNQFEAARTGDVDRLRAVLTVKNVDDKDGNTWSALHWAAWCEHVDCVKLCLEMGANVNSGCNIGYTALHFAAAAGIGRTVDVVRILLDGGAIVDPEGCGGRTPLQRAIFFNHVDVAHLLVDRGAKVSNVKLECLPAIPDWIDNFIASRSRCRSVAIVIIAIHKHHRTHSTCNNDINVLQIIGKHIWSTRMDDVWSHSQ
jgi:ankyrin repeat protein